MGLADKLLDELYHWIKKQEKCADHLMALANELENMREVINAGQLAANTATVAGSVALVGSGIATFLTGGVAAPLLVLTAGITAGVGTAASVTCSLVEKWKSSTTMQNAGKTTDEIKQIQKNIKRLREQLQEECESQGFKASSSDDVECEITARILSAMAKRSGRDLSVSHLRDLLRSNGMSTHRYPGFNLHPEFFSKVSYLLGVLGCSAAFFAAQGQKCFIPLLAEGMAALGMKAMAKGAGQFAGGVFGLIFAVPDLIDNCEELVKNNHQTEASTHLRTKANEIRKAVKELKKQLNELQEMLEQIPEMEYHINLAQEMCGSQIYTRGTICIEYKQTQKQYTRFIVVCTKDTGETECGGSKGKDKSGANTNRRQKKKATSTEDRKLKQQRKPASQSKPAHKSKTKEKGFRFRLPKILMSNVRSLSNKIEELKELMEDVGNFNHDLMFFTETWFNSNRQNISFRNHMLCRVDRDARLTGKRRGGGLMMLVNEDWATDVEVENIMITPDYELMVVSIIPHDHPADAPPLIFIHVYVPGPDFTQAAADIASFYRDAVKKYPGAPVFLLGDFNRCDITPHLDLEQFVICPTRYNNTIDLCYGNVPGAFRSKCRPPLGRSDHNIIHLIPKDISDESDSSEDEHCTHENTRPRKK